MVFDTEVKNKKFNIKQIGLKCYGGKLSKYEFFKVFWTILYPKYGHLKEENANILEMEPDLKKMSLHKKVLEILSTSFWVVTKRILIFRKCFFWDTLWKNCFKSYKCQLS